jgi:CheY-like chemotaxis protein
MSGRGTGIAAVKRIIFSACILLSSALAVSVVGMETTHKILILDDDVDWLETCRETFSQLPSKPEIRTVTTGPKALAMLDAEPYRLLICDLKMPRMDGLQVLAVVRRRFPELRTVVLSGLQDEEFRSRAYALGVDLFWLKPDMQQDAKTFMDCLESLLGRDADSGFRGIQSKSLMDIVQMECLSRSSAVLRITRGPLVGKLWFQDGELFDAEVEGARGEVAFQRILTWKSGQFENFPPDPNIQRAIHKPVNTLLLEYAQALDETALPDQNPASIENATHRKNMWKLAQLTREGAEFVIAVPPQGQGEPEAFGRQSSDQLAAWTRRALELAKSLGDKISAGPLSHVSANSPENQIAILAHDRKFFLVGWPRERAPEQLLEQSKRLVASWDS